MASVKLGLCGQLFRIIFIFTQLVFLLFGLVLLAVGIYQLVIHEDYEELTGSKYASGSALLVAAGGITVVITLIGLIGACTLSQCLLGFFTIVVVLIIILEIAAGIVGFVFRDDIADQVSDNTLQAIKDYRPKPTENGTNPNSTDDYQKDVNEAVDFIQNTFDCCGWDSIDNWIGNTFFNETMGFPDSCKCEASKSRCVNSTDFVPDFPFPDNGTLTDQNVWNRTCEDRVTDVLKANLLIVGSIGIVFGVVEIVGVLIALGLCYTIQVAKKEYTTV